jgi:hypothetical protein
VAATRFLARLWKPDQVNKQELLSKIETAHSEWQSLIAEVDQARLSEPGVTGDWSVKDLVAHVSSWQQRVLDRMDADTTGAPIEFAGRDLEEINVALYDRNRDRPLDDVLSEAEETYSRFMERVRGLSEQQLFEPGQFSFTKENPVYLWIAGDTFEHYDEHSATIREWLS